MRVRRRKQTVREESGGVDRGYQQPGGAEADEKEGTEGWKVSNRNHVGEEA